MIQSILKKIILISMCVVMLMPSHLTTIHSESINDDEFQVFLARYLDNNYLLDKLNQGMAHHYLYDAMKQQNGIIQAAVELKNMADDWGYVINGKSDVYEQILLELIDDYIHSDLFTQSVTQSYKDSVNDNYEMLSNANELADIMKEFPDLAKYFTNNEISIWELLIKLPLGELKNRKEFNQLISKMIDQWDIPSLKSIGIEALISQGMNFINFLHQVNLYLSLKDQIDGIQALFELMYRQETDKEMMQALKKISENLNALSDEQMWTIIENSFKENIIEKGSVSFIKTCVMNALGIVGVSIDAGGLLSEAIYKKSTITSAQLFLGALIDVEDSIKGAIRLRQNNYMYSVQGARELNCGLMFLYEAYEYGIEIARNFNQAVYDGGKKTVTIVNEYGEREYDYEASMKEFCSKQTTYEQYNQMLNRWEGFMENDRTVFASAWLEYQNEHISENVEYFEEYTKIITITDLTFEKEVIVLDLAERTTLGIPLTAPKMTPSNPDNPLLIYSTSNPEIVSIPNEHIYNVVPHQQGQVTITVTGSGTAKATQTIIVIDSSKTQEELPVEPEKKDYSEIYIDNEDGITVISVEQDFVTCDKASGYCTYTIPETIDGKTVTEIHFSASKSVNDWGCLENNHSDNPEDHSGHKHVQISRIVLPSSTKRIADGNNRIDYETSVEHRFHDLDIVLNEGLEEIGEYAFESISPCQGSTFVIPSTVKKIGKGAFKESGYSEFLFKTPHLTEIPDECFYKSKATRYIWTEKPESIIRIGQQAFYSTIIKAISPMDSVTEIDEEAFCSAELPGMTQLPNSLVKIGDRAFSGAYCGFNYFPETLKTIGEEAFRSADILDVSLPNSIEYIGKKAFYNVGDYYHLGYGIRLAAPLVCHGEGSGVALTIETDALKGFSEGIELPSNTRVLKNSFDEVYSLNDNYTITWTNGIDEIERSEYKLDSRYHVSMFMKETDYNGKYQIQNHIFMKNMYFDYIEIPVNYLRNTKETLSGNWIHTAVILGNATDDELRQSIIILKDAIDEGGVIIYKDRSGQSHLIYERPVSSYEKKSQALNENQFDYVASEPYSLYDHQESFLTTDSKGNVVLKGIVSLNKAAEETVKDAKLIFSCWNDEGESEAERLQQLSAFKEFEDLYLRQRYARYFTVGFENTVIKNKDAHYVISIDLSDTIYEINLDTGNLGLYRIGSTGRITRLPIALSKSKGSRILTFETDELGYFALVQLEKMKEVVTTPYLEEHHHTIDSTKQTLTEEEPVIYPNETGTTILVLEDKNKDEEKITISKPEIDKEIQDQLIQIFELDDTLINKDTNDTVQVTEDSIQSIQIYDQIIENLIQIDFPEIKGKIQISIPDIEETYPQLHIFKAEESEDKILLQDVTENHVFSLDEKQIHNELERGSNHYYQIKLDEEGLYYFTVIESDTEVLYEKAKETSWIIWIAGPAIILLIGATALIITKRKNEADE